MSNWNDFNEADDQMMFDVIPKGTLAKVILTIKPGGHDDESQGWTGGFATKSADTGAVYLSCEFTVMSGKYAKRKIWSLIGLHSEKGPTWANNGRSLIKAILNSANALFVKDSSTEAKKARQINGFEDLEGLIFLAKVDVELNQDGTEKNVIKLAVGPEHKEYIIYMSNTAQPAQNHVENNAVTPEQSWAGSGNLNHKFN